MLYKRYASTGVGGISNLVVGAMGFLVCVPYLCGYPNGIPTFPMISVAMWQTHSFGNATPSNIQHKNHRPTEQSQQNFIY